MDDILMKRIHTLLGALALAGVAVFGTAWIVSMLQPGFAEGVTRAIIRQQVEHRVHQKVDRLDADFLAGRAAVLVRAQQDRIDQARALLRANLPERLATVIAEMGRLDCECRRKVESGIRRGLLLEIASAGDAREHLTAMIRGSYLDVAGKLTREFRIFTATNALVFGLLGVATLLRRKAGLQLVAPAAVLVVAAAVTAALYLFGQDWLHTILFADYTGFAYLGYLSLVFALLSDVLFNRARVTTQIVRLVLDAIGSSLQVVPC